MFCMPDQEILYAVTGRVATVTLNRPDKLNAWTRTMEQEVRHAMLEAARDDRVRVIVLTGAGRGFCAGADMSLLQSVVEGRGHPLPDAAATGSENRDNTRADFQRQYSYLN
jgi:enoyl-CoA hydratase/carnithine racemase